MYKRTFPKKCEDGFTLIELLVVILIIGVLAAIAVPVFLNQRKVAQEGALKSDLKNAALEFEQYLVTNKKYPSKPEEVPVKTSTGNHVEVPTVDYTVISMKENAKPSAIDVQWKMVSNGTTQNPWVNYSTYADADYNINTILTTNCSDGTKPSTSSGLNFGPWGDKAISQFVGFPSCAAASAKAESVTVSQMYNSTIPTTTVSPAQANAAAGNDKDFCIQGYNDNNPGNFWKYSSKDGGLVKGKC
jgi:prepilin-type N-terminal cleavage/methylation domain-containing protein